MSDSKIKYYSTNLKAPEVSFRKALLSGLAPDGGLYMPVTIPEIEKDEMNGFRSMEYHEIAASVLMHFLINEIDDYSLARICKGAYNFEIPLERVYDKKYVLRLDRGPTASFKDFAARMMARLIHFYTTAGQQHYTVLTATSGDTGSAVANAFHGLDNIDVIIVFPVNEVSSTQRKQMTTLKENIHVVAIDGKFDDCQQLVKRAFLDSTLSQQFLLSANSINIGRLLPQTIYYFYAWSRLALNHDDQVIFSVPSGNFGNLMGGLIAKEMGLPVRRFIISTNRNDEVPEYLKHGKYSIIHPSYNCISSAMNVGHPGNMARIIALYGGMMNEKGIIVKEPDLVRMQRDLYGISVTDKETLKTIADCCMKHGVLLEPHGAVAWKGLELYYEQERSYLPDDQVFISLETAHPAKFGDKISRILGFTPPRPDSLEKIDFHKEEYIELENDYEKLRRYILKH